MLNRTLRRIITANSFSTSQCSMSIHVRAFDCIIHDVASMISQLYTLQNKTSNITMICYVIMNSVKLTALYSDVICFCANDRPFAIYNINGIQH